MIGKETFVTLKYDSFILHCELIVSEAEPEVGYKGGYEVQKIIALDRIEDVYDFMHQVGSVEAIHQKIEEELLKTK